MTRHDFQNRIANSIILFDGGMGTELYKKGVFINKCFDELNITNPNMVKMVHEDYKNAGADVIETNTYGANRPKLTRFQLQDKLYDINLSGAKLAREIAGQNLLVAGAIGPLGIQMEPLGPLSRNEVKDYFKEQIIPLIDGGVDLIIFETFIYPDELKQAVLAVRELSDIAVVAQMTIDEDASSLTGASASIMIKELQAIDADAIGVNCTVGPQIMLNWLEQARTLTEIPISIMPNAGKPKNVDGRNIYLTSPEYMAEYAKNYILNGANIIGGCCGTAPEHIKSMRNAINALMPKYTKKEIKIDKITIDDSAELVPVDKKSRLAKRLTDGHFVKFVELLPPHGVSAVNEIDKAREMFFNGIDVINIPDGPRASARMSALSLAVQIQRDVGIETLLHFVCRDRNVIGMQSDLLGAYALGLRNILSITGDPPKLGNYPDATAVFDVDAIGLVNILDRLNHGLDIAGNPIGRPTGFFIGVGANPGAINLNEELKRLDWKIEAGAEYIITQPVFDIDVFENFINRIQHIKKPVIAGLWPLTSFRNAEFMNNEVPGCNVPDNLMNRLSKVQESKEASREVGIQIARETLENMLGMIQGVQISAPFGRVQSVIDVISGFTFN